MQSRALRPTPVLPVLAVMALACDPAPEPDPAPSEPSVVVRFDAAAGRLPDGLAIDGERVLIGMLPTGEIVSVDRASGDVETYARLPPLPPEGGFTLGLALDDEGALYVGLASFVPEVASGVYRVAEAGAPAELFAAHDELTLPNGLAFTDDGALLVTDPAAGAVFRFEPDGTGDAWLRDATIAGDPEACDGPALPFPVGANGIDVGDGAVYIANTDRGSVVRVELEADGSAADPHVIAGPDCADLHGADGLVVGPRAQVYVAVNFDNRIVRIDPDGAIETIWSGEPAQEPASVALDGDTLLWSNLPLLMEHEEAQPGLMAIDVGPLSDPRM